MPFVWHDPELAMTHRGIRVYHTYKDSDMGHPYDYWYSFSMADDEGTFDVRTLPPCDFDVTQSSGRLSIIQFALDNGDLKAPADLLPPRSAVNCTHKNLCVGSYQVGNANNKVTLVRDVTTNKVIDFEFNRIDGDVGSVAFYCEDCGDWFEWEQLLDF